MSRQLCHLCLDICVVRQVIQEQLGLKIGLITYVQNTGFVKKSMLKDRWNHFGCFRRSVASVLLVHIINCFAHFLIG